MYIWIYRFGRKVIQAIVFHLRFKDNVLMEKMHYQRFKSDYYSKHILFVIKKKWTIHTRDCNKNCADIICFVQLSFHLIIIRGQEMFMGYSHNGISFLSLRDPEDRDHEKEGAEVLV